MKVPVCRQMKTTLSSECSGCGNVTCVHHYVTGKTAHCERCCPVCPKVVVRPKTARKALQTIEMVSEDTLKQQLKPRRRKGKK